MIALLAIVLVVIVAAVGWALLELTDEVDTGWDLDPYYDQFGGDPEAEQHARLETDHQEEGHP